jgi:hypothetical protein
MYECAWCGKSYPDKRHEELEEVRAMLVRGIYEAEAELARNKYSPRLFLDNKFLDRLRKRLKSVNGDLKEIDDEI